MTKIEFLLMLNNIWLASSIKDQRFKFGISLFYLFVAIAFGLLGK
jgi:hypothetical protein